MFLKLYPARAATNFVRQEHARIVDGAALVVAVIYEGQQPPEHARRLLHAFPIPFVDSQGVQWCATAPRQFSSGQRTKIEFVSSLQWFLEEGPETAIRLGRSCTSVLGKIIEVAATLTSS